jgi:hypothetical protein
MEELIAWADAAAGAREVARHLLGCPRCRETALRIRMSAGVPEEAAHDAALGETFDHLHVRMQAWNSLSGASTARHILPLRARSAHRQYSALEVYFGKETADRIIHSARRDSSDRRLMPAAEPLFHAFLGRRAAEALVRQIAGTAA